MHLVKTLESRKDTLLEALPAHVGKDRFFRVMLGEIRTNPRLLTCSPESVLQSVLEAARLGLEIGGNLNQSWLVPYGKECKLQLGYGGMLTLAKNSGDVAAVYAECVHRKDHFTRAAYSIEHEWDPFSPRGAFLGVYCVLTLTNGERQYETMSKAEVDGIRDRSKAGKSGPWVTDYHEMARKTVLRRALKKVRLSPEAQDAVSRDDDAHFVKSKVVESKPLGNRAVLDMVRGEQSEEEWDEPVADDPAGGDSSAGVDRGGASDRVDDPERQRPPAKKRAVRTAKTGGSESGAAKSGKDGGRSAKTADDLEQEGNAKQDEDNPF